MSVASALTWSQGWILMCVQACGKHGINVRCFLFSTYGDGSSGWAWSLSIQLGWEKNTLRNFTCVPPQHRHLQAHKPCTQLLHGSWGLRLSSHACIVGTLAAEPQIGSIFICRFQSFFSFLFPQGLTILATIEYELSHWWSTLSPISHFSRDTRNINIPFAAPPDWN